MRSASVNHDGRSFSAISGRGSKAGSQAMSRSLSQLSKASNKSVKSINASLEKTHTFGMSNIHKNKFDIYKIDKDFETNDKKG